MLRPRWRKVFRDLWQEKSRTGIVVASVAVGVIAFGGLFGSRTVVVDNILIEYRRFNENDIAFQIDGFDDDVVRWAQRQDFITDAQGVTIYSAEALLPDGTEDVVLTAFDDYNDLRINRVLPEDGVFPPERGDVVVERSYADGLGLPIRSEITLEVGENSQRYTLDYVGTVHDLNAFPSSVDPQIKLYVTPRTLAQLGFDTQYNLLYVTIDRDAMALARSDIDTVTDDLRDRIEQQLGLPVLGAQINRENNLWAGDFATAIASILFLVGSAALVLCCLLVVNVITGILTRQRRQVGVMKMIGATGPQIAGLYFVLVGTFGVLALVLAVPVSRLLARGVAGALLGEGFLNVNVSVFQLPLFVLIVQVTVSIAAPILAALAPIVQGARVSPIESLRDSTNANPDWIDRLLARLKGLPRPVLLTLRNTFRRKARLASTLFTLVIAGGFFMGSLNIRVSVLREAESVPLAGSDLRFTLADTYDVDGVRRRLQSVTGITFSEGWLNGSVSRSRPDGTRSDVLTLNGIPWNSPYNQPILTEGRWLTEPNSFNRRDIVISTEFASLEPDVGVGDALTLHLDGDEQTWNVVGIVETGGPTSTTPPLYTYYDSGARFLGLPRQTNFLLASTNTGSLALDRMIERQVLAELDRFDIDVAAAAVVLEESENARSSFDVIIFLLAFVALLIAVVGGFGLGGTMSLSVMERTREIGVMRSVGASSSTLRGMYVLESLIIGGMSFVMALPFSLLVSYGFAVAIAGIFGRDRPLEFGINPLGFALWALIVVVVAVFASLAPAQRAAQISIREALAYE